MKTWQICMLAMAVTPFVAAQNAVEPAAVPVEKEPHHHVVHPVRHWCGSGVHRNVAGLPGLWRAFQLVHWLLSDDTLR